MAFRLFIMLLLGLPVVACRAESDRSARWPHLTIQVPVGYRSAAAAILPGARILERNESAAAAADSPAIDLIASFAPPEAEGHSDRGVWLIDRIRLVRRLTGGEAEELKMIEAWIDGAAFAEGEPRFGLAPGLEQRLDGARPPLAIFVARGRRHYGDAVVEDLLAGRLDAAFLDGAAYATLSRRQHAGRDLLFATVLDEGGRELRLYAARDRRDLGPAVERLVKGRAALESMGYDPAP